MSIMDNNSGYKAVLRMARDKPDWIPIIKAALEESNRTENDFAGAWVLNRLKEQETIEWFPNLRSLVSYGILKKEDTTRGGKRAYYSMIDPDGVEKALLKLEKSESG